MAPVSQRAHTEKDPQLVNWSNVLLVAFSSVLGIGSGASNRLSHCSVSELFALPFFFSLLIFIQTLTKLPRSSPELVLCLS